jgi:hypothetical protein
MDDANAPMVVVEVVAAGLSARTRVKVPPGTRPGHGHLRRLARLNFPATGRAGGTLTAVGPGGTPRIDVADDAAFEAFWGRYVLVRTQRPEELPGARGRRGGAFNPRARRSSPESPAESHHRRRSRPALSSLS